MRTIATIIIATVMAVGLTAGEVTTTSEPCADCPPQTQTVEVQVPQWLETRVRTEYDTKNVTEQYTDYETRQRTVMDKKQVIEQVPTTQTRLKTEQYTDYETRTKTVMVPQEVAEQVAVTKTREVPESVTVMQTRTREVDVPRVVNEQVAVTKTRTKQVVVPRQVVEQRCVPDTAVASVRQTVRVQPVVVRRVAVQPVAVQRVAVQPVVVAVQSEPTAKEVRMRPTLRQRGPERRRTKRVVLPTAEAPPRAPSTTAVPVQVQYVRPSTSVAIGQYAK